MNDYINLCDVDIRKQTKTFKLVFIILSIIVVILLIVGIFNKYVFGIGLAFVITPIAAFGSYFWCLQKYEKLAKIENDELCIYKYNKKLKFKLDLKNIKFSNYIVRLSGFGAYDTVVERECLVLHFNELEKWRFYEENIIDYRYCNKDNSVVVIHNKVLTEFIMKNYVFKNHKNTN